MIKRVTDITNRISMNLLGVEFKLHAHYDKIHGSNGRIYIQIAYTAPCTKTNDKHRWTGRKWYLSEFMTDDEIVKTAWCAFESCIKHELMEGFKVDDKILFNPHVNFEELLKISDKEIKRL